MYSYEMGVFPSQNNHKNLDPFFKGNQDFWDCFIREKRCYSEITQD